MVKLAKCCQTCAYTYFSPRTSRNICKYYQENNGYSLWVHKPFVCEHWKDSRKSEKTPITRPTRRQLYWRKQLEELNRKMLGI